MEQTSTTILYDLLITKNLNPRLLDANGQEVTNPDDAEMMSFDWVTENHNYGTVVIMINAKTSLEIYFGNNITKSLDPKDSNAWYSFLQQLKQFAVRNLLTFDIKNISRLKYNMQGQAAINEGLFEGWRGKKDISYNDTPNNARIMIKHNKDIGKDEPRYRAIESLFIETAEGERFKLPFKSLMGAKCMARHVKEGGKPFDAFGNHIVEMMNQINTLGRFINATKRKQFDEAATPMIEIAGRTYRDLKDKAKRMIGKRGYHKALEEFDPAQITVEDEVTNDVKSLFIEKSIDPRIEEALPMLARLGMTALASQIEENPMKEVSMYENWANGLVEGTWNLPDTEADMEELKKIMSQPLPCGADGENATNVIYGLLGDDELFDDIYELSTRDPNADCRPLVAKRLEDFGIEIDIETEVETSEDLDTDGVMMTRPSNMSSESVEDHTSMDRLIELSGLPKS